MNVTPNLLFLYSSSGVLTRDVFLHHFGKAVHEEFPSVMSFELHYRISFHVHSHFSLFLQNFRDSVY